MSDRRTMATNNHGSTCRLSRKPIKKRHRALLTCVICDGIAYGYNFDAITCESCKAFFRRNARRPAGKFKCHGDDHCDVGVQQKKRCKKCRIEKCFQAGMRKDWILTDDEKQEKRIKIEQNRLLKQNQSNVQLQSIKNESIDGENLSAPVINEEFLSRSDWTKMKSLQVAYARALQLNQINGIVSYPLTQSIESTFDFFRIPIHLLSMRLITYFKQIEEFQTLNSDEQVYLVKLNTITLTFINYIFIYDHKKKIYYEQGTTDPLFLENDWIKTINWKFHDDMKQIRKNFTEIVPLDRRLLDIFFLMILFSNHLNYKYSAQNIDTLTVFNLQNIYTNLFYKYCLHYYGLHRSSTLFLRCITNLMKMQTLVTELKSTINDFLDVTRLEPLMQSLL